MSQWINYIARGIGIASIGFTLLISFMILSSAPEGFDISAHAILLAIPAIILSAMLWTAWGSPLWGGLGFFMIGLLPSTIFGGEDWVNFALAAPILITGLLFISANVIEKFNEPT